MSGVPVDEIGAPSAEAFKFTEIGDTCKGVVTYAGKMVRENSFNGLDEETLLITLLTSDGERAIYPVTNTNVNGDGYASRMAKAIAAAIRKADSRTLEVGGTLAVKFSEEHPTTKGNPAKGFQAQYKPPAAPVKDDDADDGAVDDLI